MAVAALEVPLDFAAGRRNLPCQRPDRARWWFAPEDEPGLPKLTERHAQAAVQLCGPCPLLLECRRYALADRSIRDGIWGGVRLSGMPANTRTALLRETNGALRRRTA